MIWTVYSASHSALDFVARTPGPSGKSGEWVKERNRREADTLARILDLAIIEFGTDLVEKSAAFEVLLRRFHAVIWADRKGNWDQACLLEELPSARSPNLHQVIVKDLVKLNQLVDQADGKIHIKDDS